jgi:hypothetical protein
VQVAETLPPDSQPSFLVSVVTQKATQSDEPGLDQTLDGQAQSGLERPSELYADGAYLSAPRLHKAAEEGWSLMGPAPAGAGSPAKLKISASTLPTDALTALPATQADVAAASARPAKPKSPTVLSGARATANAARGELSAFRPTKTIAR